MCARPALTVLPLPPTFMAVTYIGPVTFIMQLPVCRLLLTASPPP